MTKAKNLLAFPWTVTTKISRRGWEEFIEETLENCHRKLTKY